LLFFWLHAGGGRSRIRYHCRDGAFDCRDPEFFSGESVVLLEAAAGIRLEAMGAVVATRLRCGVVHAALLPPALGCEELSTRPGGTLRANAVLAALSPPAAPVALRQPLGVDERDDRAPCCKLLAYSRLAATFSAAAALSRAVLLLGVVERLVDIDLLRPGNGDTAEEGGEEDGPRPRAGVEVADFGALRIGRLTVPVGFNDATAAAA